MRRALNLLKPVLDAFIRQKLAGVPGARVPRDADLQGLLRAMLDNRGTFFSGRSGEALKHNVNLLRGARNWNAHDVVLDEREARQVIETVAIVAERIGAPHEVIAATDALNAPPQALSVPPAAPSGARVPPPSPPPGTAAAGAGGSSDRRPPRVQPRRDAAGVIVNADELTADEVALQRVLCPGCREKVFEEWSAGWDAHAAHRCAGMTADTTEERKSEFRRRFGHLFRAPARGESQRAVMRHIWERCCPDDERAIREYADAEQRGEVRRTNNASGLLPEGYARALLADGLRKGWLRPCG
ncbi:hypothetical protein [Gemmatirosa kalamazoonensis]|uniref:hypothetical protein n=1 Tax=Gemmatirosa kalamazoonensis TaxID=861299 RepID=UPI00046D8459|nr:hypothetical protein [Gemmatirosa kalamazoonensis]